MAETRLNTNTKTLLSARARPMENEGSSPQYHQNSLALPTPSPTASTSTTSTHSNTNLNSGDISSSQNRKPRDKACFRCRQKKLKCTSEIPACRRCAWNKVDCSYDNMEEDSTIENPFLAMRELENMMDHLEGDAEAFWETVHRTKQPSKMLKIDPSPPSSFPYLSPPSSSASQTSPPSSPNNSISSSDEKGDNKKYHQQQSVAVASTPTWNIRVKASKMRVDTNIHSVKDILNFLAASFPEEHINPDEKQEEYTDEKRMKAPNSDMVLANRTFYSTMAAGALYHRTVPNIDHPKSSLSTRSPEAIPHIFIRLCLETYLDEWNILHPIVHSNRFLAQFNSPTFFSSSFHLLLTSICAFIAPMAFEIHSLARPELRSLPRKVRTGEHFSTLAKPLLAEASMDDQTLELLQSLLLLNLHHVRNPHSTELVRNHEWQIRVAPTVKESLREPWELQIYQRIWYMIVQNDSMFALQGKLPADGFLGSTENIDIDKIYSLPCEPPHAKDSALYYRAFLHGSILFCKVMRNLYTDEVREWNAQHRYDKIAVHMNLMLSELDNCFCLNIESQGLSFARDQTNDKPIPLRFRSSLLQAILLGIARCKCTLTIYFPLLPQGHSSQDHSKTLASFKLPENLEQLHPAQFEALQMSAYSAARLVLLACTLQCNNIYAFPLEQIRDAATFFVALAYPPSSPSSSHLPSPPLQSLNYGDGDDYPSPSFNESNPNLLAPSSIKISYDMAQRYLRLLVEVVRSTQQYKAGVEAFTDFVKQFERLPGPSFTIGDSKPFSLSLIGEEWVSFPIEQSDPVWVAHGLLGPGLTAKDELPSTVVKVENR